MKVFISWSGDPSRAVAHAIRRWLPLVVQHVKPWMSDEEIASGTRWNDSIALALNDTDFGIICVTGANQHKSWLMFEAGALAKRLEVGRLVPLCVDITPSEITGPLASFQGRNLDRDGMRRLVHDVSTASEKFLDRTQVDTVFDALWPQLDEELRQVNCEAPDPVPPRRSHEDMLAELVERTRSIERTIQQQFKKVELVNDNGSVAMLANDDGGMTIRATSRNVTGPLGVSWAWRDKEVGADPDAPDGPSRS